MNGSVWLVFKNPSFPGSKYCDLESKAVVFILDFFCLMRDC